ncbi:MAG: P-type conjugative transfer protein VirB9 [Wolbachia endosymbiont of Tyrophagus putrescentiae]|nr:P-type conjugative transfer protein VirB9 [Wolbachia endosymbiont of Tyrophagus putrescentiae]
MYKILLALILLVSNSLSASTNYSNPISVDSRIKTFVYNPNEVFTVVFSQGYYSYVEFAEGEKVRDIAIGDASGWKIGHSDNKLFIMPFEDKTHTNMIVTTTKKRSYVFDLVSRPNYYKQPTEHIDHHDSAEKDISYIVRFYYPTAEDEFDVDQNEVSMPTQMQYVVDNPEKIVEENDTKYNYTYINHGNDEDIVPVELFDDGYLTYFKFKDNNKIPQIFIKGENKASKRLLFDGYIIIKGVHKKLFMRYQDNEVEIINGSL